MKALHFILAALFLYIAYIQLNDPDPLYWIIIYAGTAAIALAKGLGRSSEFWTRFERVLVNNSTVSDLRSGAFHSCRIRTRCGTHRVAS